MTTHVLVTEAGARLGVVSCALRNTGTGWAVISNTGHEPSGITGLVQNSDHIELQHSISATRVISMLVTPDETYAQVGLRAGASAGLTLSRIYLYSGASGSAALDPATVSAASGNLWVSGLFKL